MTNEEGQTTEIAEIAREQAECDALRATLIEFVQGRLQPTPDEAQILYSYWAKAAFWSCEEAAALILGAYPEIFRSEFCDLLPTKARKEFEAITDLVRRNFEASAGRVPPKDIIAWADKVGIVMPAQLVSALGGGKGESMRQHDNMLGVIAGLSIMHYSYNLDKRNSACKQIASDLEAMGLGVVKEDAIRRYLLQAEEIHADKLRAAQAYVAANPTLKSRKAR